MRIEITRKEGNYTKLWVFSYFKESDLTLYLENYRYSLKIEGKRVHQVIQQYDRLMTRNNTLTVEEVPFPDEVKNEALKTFIDKITVKKWDRK